MNVMSILGYIEDEISSAPNAPFSSRCTVDREKCLNLINDIRQHLPTAIVEAESIRNEKNQILYDAEKEGEYVISDAEQRANRLIDENEITKAAYAKAEELIANAQVSAREIRNSANAYVEDMLTEIEAYIARYLELVRQNREQMKQR